eukprot:177196-Hanusia_phi.AAC.3
MSMKTRRRKENGYQGADLFSHCFLDTVNGRKGGRLRENALNKNGQGKQLIPVKAPAPLREKRQVGEEGEAAELEGAASIA